MAIFLFLALIFKTLKGTLPFNVEFRHFDYKEWYPGLWNKDENPQGDEGLPKRTVSVDDIYQNPDIVFPIHNRDFNTHWYIFFIFL